MIAKGFRPVGWVAAVGAAALGCYMVSLNVASERAELVSLERQIVLAKRDIRSLETELSTRGRLSQLEHWNADVLALSAPTTKQFVADEVQLARFDRNAPTIEQRAKVQMAAAEIAPKQQPKIAPADYKAAADAAEREQNAAPLVRKASLDTSPQIAAAPVAKVSAPRAAAPAPKKVALLKDGLAKDIEAAAKREQAGESAGR
jgi:hypothetical protein